MTAPATETKPHSTRADTTAAVEEFMAKLVHASKAEVQAIRRSILGSAPGIAEGIKWKSPSFRTHEYFATVNLRDKEGVAIILHRGAKVRETGPGGLLIDDPNKLLKWLAADRASIRFTSASDFESKRLAFEKLIRAWLQHM
jgi:hypothetical protein